MICLRCNFYICPTCMPLKFSAVGSAYSSNLLGLGRVASAWRGFGL